MSETGLEELDDARGPSLVADHGSPFDACEFSGGFGGAFEVSEFVYES